MRIRGMNEETGKTDAQVKKAMSSVKGLTGVSVFTDEAKNQYKSTYDLMKQIAEIYPKLSDAKQAHLLEDLAGKRQGNVVASLLKNWKDVEGATKASQNSVGSAEKEQAAYMDSISAKVNSFKETIVGLEQQLIDGNAVKGIVDFGTNALSVFTKLNSVVGTLPTLFATVSSIISVTGKDSGKQEYAHLLKAA